jgi:hypothetical protein
MTATPYKPISFTNEAVTQQKMIQLANNQQWLFENNPRMRYSVSGIIRDAGTKVIVGKSPFPFTPSSNFSYVPIYFGSFFTAGCKPVVVATAESANDGFTHRAHVAIQGFGGEINNIGFTAIVANEAWGRNGPGWINWQAIGY